VRVEYGAAAATAKLGLLREAPEQPSDSAADYCQEEKAGREAERLPHLGTKLTLTALRALDVHELYAPNDLGQARRAKAP
jgi:hypothetical protein